MLEFETLFRRARQALKDEIVKSFPQDAAFDDAVRMLCKYFDKDTEHLVAEAKCKLQVKIKRLEETISFYRTSVTALSSWVKRLENLFRRVRDWDWQVTGF